MSPEQETSPQYVSIKDIATAAGFNPNDRKDFAVVYGRIHDFTQQNPTITIYEYRKKHFFLLTDAKEIVRGITGPIRRTTGTFTLADRTEDKAPQEHLSPEELLERSREERDNNRLKKQIREQRRKEAKIIKQQMPIYFTNEVLEYILGNQLNDLNRNLHILLDHALNKVNSGNGKITLAFVLDGQSKEDAQKYFIQHFNSLLQRGFNNTNTQNHQPLSKEEKKLIEQCNWLKDHKRSQEKVLKEVCIHFSIPSSYIFLGA